MDPIEDRETLAELESVRDLMRLMSNAASVFQSYPPDNHVYLNFAGQLGEKFSAHLQQYGNIVLLVGHHELLYDGQEVYSEANAHRSLALKLYRDGVRRIQFLEGLEKDEIVGFVKVLAQNPKPEDQEEDIVTVLWEKDFPHVKYAVLDVIPDEKAEAGAAGQEKGLSGETVEEEEEAPTGRVVEAQYKDIRSEVQQITEEMKNTVAALDEAALKRGQDQIRQAMESDITSRVSLVLYDAVGLEKDPELAAGAVDLLGQLVRSSLERGNIKDARSVLIRLKDMSQPDSGLGRHELELAKRSLSDLADEQVMQNLASIADEDVPKRSEALRRFLLAWGEDAVAPAIRLAGMVKYNEAIIDALFELGRNRVDLCVQGLSRQNAASVLAVLKVLGEVADASIAGHLKGCVESPDVRIKVAAIRTLAKLGADTALELLEAVLDDEDPGVRREAIQAVGKLKASGVFKLLEGRVSEETFINRTMEEKRLILSTMAETGGKDAISALERILKRKRLLRSREQNESRASAAYALGHIDSSEARSLLESYQDDRSREVRAACRAALSRIAEADKGKRTND